MKEQTLPGDITISRFPNTDTVSIVVNDKSSGLRVLEVHMDVTNFADALFNMGYRPCTHTLYDNRELIGKIREVKDHSFALSRVKDGDEEDVEKHLRETCPEVFEGGWFLRMRDLSNPHNYAGDGKVRVSMWRYVDE